MRENVALPSRSMGSSVSWMMTIGLAPIGCRMHTMSCRPIRVSARLVVFCDPVYEVPPRPNGFDNFHKSFAILTDRDLKQMPQPPDFLNGAGLCIRRVAWEKLAESGFRFQLRIA